MALPIVWTVAGSDSGAGAGIQADLRAFDAFGVHGCTVVAAITAQNSVEVSAIEAVSEQLLQAQLDALARDLKPRAIKTGLLGSIANLRVLVRMIDRLRAADPLLAVVVDPVLRASTGARLANAELLAAYRDELLPRATLATPNRAEAAALLGLPALESRAEVEAAAQALKGGGCEAVVITGGDAGRDTDRDTGGDANRDATANAAGGADCNPADDAADGGIGDTSSDAGGNACGALSEDYMLTEHASGWLSLPRVAAEHDHGTGCVFASSAAAALARGFACADAVVLAKMATTHALRQGRPAGRGAGPVLPHQGFSRESANLPKLLPPSPHDRAIRFAPLSNPWLGLYAVVDSAAWVRRVLGAGVRTVQLRIRDAHHPALKSEIRESVAAARAVQAQLFINDHWRIAIEEGAYGVHLGQDDLLTADLARIAAAGVRLGLSSHSYWEVCRAFALGPSYIACGPIHATNSKPMPWIPQGNENLAYWCALLPCPVVAIAGMDAGRAAQAVRCGASGVALITAITEAPSPEQAIADFARSIDAARNELQLPPPALPRSTLARGQ